MSIFTNILRKIFPSSHPAVTGGTPPAKPTAAPPAAAAPSPTSAGPAAAAPAPAPAVAPMATVDVEAILNEKAKQAGQPLNWRTSIVDLMKLLGLDSSLSERQALAKELGYTGSTSDSAAMNIWLHRQVMTRLAQNGGRVPDDLKD